MLLNRRLGYPKDIDACSAVAERRLAMGWILLTIVAGLAIGGLVGGTVLHPFLYGLFVAAIIIVPLWIASSIVGAIFNGIFGRR